MHLRKSDP